MVNGMASICELLINVVSGNKPKMLFGTPSGLSQKGNGASVGGSRSPTMGKRLVVLLPKLPANREGLNHFCHSCGTW